MFAAYCRVLEVVFQARLVNGGNTSPFPQTMPNFRIENCENLDRVVKEIKGIARKIRVRKILCGKPNEGKTMERKKGYSTIFREITIEYVQS